MCSSNRLSGHLTGNCDSKCHSERENDSVEVGCSLSQEYNNLRHPFIENGESEKAVLGENQNGKIEDDGILKIEDQLNSQQDDKSRYVGVEHVEFQKALKESEPSNNDFRPSEKRSEEVSCIRALNFTRCHNEERKAKEVTQIPENGRVLEEVANNSVVKTHTSVVSDKPMVAVFEVVEHLTKGAQIKTAEPPKIIDCIFKDCEDKLLSTANTEVKDSKSLIKSGGVSDDVLLPKSNNGTGVLKAVTVSEKETGKSFPMFDENVGFTANGTEGKILVSSVVHRLEPRSLAEYNKEALAYDLENSYTELSSHEVHTAETSDNVDNATDMEITEHIEKLPLVTSTPRVVLAEKTSWLSCCGLLDIFTGSSR